MQANRELLEKLLDSKASSWAGLAAIVPLLLAIIFLGTISFKVGRYTAPLIERMLAPPPVEQAEELEFEASMPNQQFDPVFQNLDLIEDESVSVPTPAAEDDVGAIQPVHTPDNNSVALSSAPTNQPQWQPTTRSVEANADATADPSGNISTADPTVDEEATLRARPAQRPTTAGDSGPKLAASGGAALGRDRSGEVEPNPAANEPVVITSQSPEPSEGVGISTPASQEKLDLTGWILKNQSPLRPAIAEALSFSELKADRTASGTVVDQNGKIYQLFFLHRTENDLLRILVVDQSKAYRIDLPDFYLEANHVKTGRVFRGPAPADSFDPGPIIEVALESVSAIPDEVPFIFDLVLRWLEIKGQE